ncbi:MAG: hypothetical protein ABSA48_12015 [Terracidiphilus sp.]
MPQRRDRRRPFYHRDYSFGGMKRTNELRQPHADARARAGYPGPAILGG